MKRSNGSPIDRDSNEPVFKQIYRILLSEINEELYNNAGKLPSEKDLCLRFDVERNTVRKALRILTEEKRITRVPGVGSQLLPSSRMSLDYEAPGNPSGYPGAALPANTQKNNIVLLITQVDYPRSPERGSFNYILVNSFEERLFKLGYNMLFKPVGQDRIVSETIMGAAPCGIIFNSLIQESFYREAAAFDLPCVSVNHYTPLFTSIVSNNFEGAYQIVKRLIDAGHRRIACITGRESHQTNRERLNGVLALCSSQGISMPNEYIIPGEWNFNSGAEATKKILDMKAGLRPTAIFAFNDEMAYGCLNELKEQGISVPEDISLAGFDNNDRYKAILQYPITTVDVNMNTIVDYACWYLTSSISGLTPKGRAKIQIDTTICDNGTIKHIRS